MDSKDFYSYWNDVENRAFLPDSKDRVKWLNRFLTFLNNKLYEREFKYVNKKPKDNKFSHEIEFAIHDITCKFSIYYDDLSKFSFLIRWKDTSLKLEYDNQYTCEFDYLEEHCSRSNEFNKNALEEVLKSKIYHPAIHCHIDAKDLDNAEGKEADIPHDIRIGPANKNPFFFLYQLAFQFLYGLEDRYGHNKKDQEFKRLINVILENKNKMKIAPGVLFPM